MPALTMARDQGRARRLGNIALNGANSFSAEACPLQREINRFFTKTALPAAAPRWIRSAWVSVLVGRLCPIVFYCYWLTLLTESFPRRLRPNLLGAPSDGLSPTLIKEARTAGKWSARLPLARLWG